MYYIDRAMVCDRWTRKLNRIVVQGDARITAKPLRSVALSLNAWFFALGLNAAIPEGCSFGYHAGGWGKPPVDETGKPLYGDVFGSSAAAGGVAQIEQDIDKMYVFGAVDQGKHASSVIT